MMATVDHRPDLVDRGVDGARGELKLGGGDLRRRDAARIAERPGDRSRLRDQRARRGKVLDEVFGDRHRPEAVRQMLALTEWAEHLQGFIEEGTGFAGRRRRLERGAGLGERLAKAVRLAGGPKELRSAPGGLEVGAIAMSAVRGAAEPETRRRARRGVFVGAIERRREPAFALRQEGQLVPDPHAMARQLDPELRHRPRGRTPNPARRAGCRVRARTSQATPRSGSSARQRPLRRSAG